MITNWLVTILKKGCRLATRFWSHSGSVQTKLGMCCTKCLSIHSLTCTGRFAFHAHSAPLRTFIRSLAHSLPNPWKKCNFLCHRIRPFWTVVGPSNYGSDKPKIVSSGTLAWSFAHPHCFSRLSPRGFRRCCSACGHFRCFRSKTDMTKHGFIALCTAKIALIISLVRFVSWMRA